MAISDYKTTKNRIIEAKSEKSITRIMNSIKLVMLLFSDCNTFF